MLKKRISVVFISISFFAAIIFGACSQESPTPPLRTSEKAGASPVSNAEGDSGDSGAGEADAELGLTLYNEKCLQCHDPAPGAKANHSGPEIMAEIDNPAHGSVDWPDETEADHIAEAIKE